LPPPGFNPWYAAIAQHFGLDPNWASPLHFYNWPAAFAAGVQPDPSGHWPSEFKLLGHPNLIVNGLDTRTESPATPALDDANKKAYWLAWLRSPSGLAPIPSRIPKEFLPRRPSSAFVPPPPSALPPMFNLNDYLPPAPQGPMQVTWGQLKALYRDPGDF